MTPTELFTVRAILLAKEEGEYEWLQRFAQTVKLRDILVSLQEKGIILKSWKLPKEGTRLIIEDIPFNQNFQKQFFRASFEMGEELFYTYPLSAVVQGTVYNLRSVSKHFGTLEDSFRYYAKSIKNNSETHQLIIDDLKWAIETQYSGFTTLDRFIIDRGWEHIHALRSGDGINVNLDAVKMI